MTRNAPPASSDSTDSSSHPIARRFAQIGVLILVYAALLFGAAGRLDWAAGWAYMGIYVAFIALNAVLLLPGRRDLIAERGRVAPNTQRWDRVLAAFYTLTGPAILVIGGLDRRFDWTEPFPLVVPVVAGVVMALGYGLFSWAMVSNPFFSTVVRIQTDRGHTVATGGPYRFVRHPGYAGALALTLATPFLLGSWPALIPSVALVAILVVRTILEDRTLRRELPGYTEYAGRVRYRLLPGIW
jgi:protein-S-isoprenylcysteine O-methyltransferase Ste14